MRVKKYLVETMPEAMSQIRQELGKDAVIVSTKQVKVGGFAGMFRKSMIEVTAAVDEDMNAKPQAAQSSVSSPVRAAVPASMARNAYSNRSQGQAGAAHSLPLDADVKVRSGGMKSLVAEEDEDISSNVEAAKVFAKQLSLAVEEQTLASQRSQAVETVKFSRVEEASQDAASKVNSVNSLYHGNESPVSTPWAEADQNLRNEIMEMKSMMKVMLKGQEQDAWPDRVKQMHHRLLEQGVEAEVAHRYVSEAWLKAKQLTMTITPELAFKPQLKAMLQDLLVASTSPKLSLETRIVYFAGPTGVGKTTTIAKLAADQMFQHRRKVGFITADTYRIAAVEQLRTYASILNAPLEVVTSPNDLGRALEALDGCDLILMDTAGRNYRNEMYVNELYSMIKPHSGSETFLVLSMTMKTDDIFGILDRFKSHHVERLVLTKADETDTYGGLVNLAELTSIPISYITYGQNVPNDIKPFAPEEWIDKLLGE